MGFFARLSNAKIAPAEAAELSRELKVLNRDGRLHARIRLQDPSLASLTLPNGCVGEVIDLSYGGIAAMFPAEVLKSAPTTPLVGTLKLLGQEVQARMTIVRVSSQGASAGLAIGGFCMHHETPAGLLFLREVIEPSRHGETMGLVPRDLRQDRYRSEHWHCFRGDGPTDLILRTAGPEIRPEEALLTFRMNETYWELALRSGQLKTGRALGGVSGATDAASARMGSTIVLDPKILRAAAFILAASPPACLELTRPILEQARLALRSSLVAAPSV